MTRLIAIFAILVAGFFITVAAQDRKTFTVGTASAARGQKATGVIEVPAGSDPALSIPVAVFHGAKPARSHAEEALRASSTLRRRIAHRRGHEPVALETIERRVHGPQEHAAPARTFDLPCDQHAIRVVADPKGREENHQLEVGEEPEH